MTDSCKIVYPAFHNPFDMPVMFQIHITQHNDDVYYRFWFPKNFECRFMLKRRGFSAKRYGNNSNGLIDMFIDNFYFAYSKELL